MMQLKENKSILLNNNKKLRVIKHKHKKNVKRKKTTHRGIEPTTLKT